VVEGAAHACALFIGEGVVDVVEGREQRRAIPGEDLAVLAHLLDLGRVGPLLLLHGVECVAHLLSLLRKFLLLLRKVLLLLCGAGGGLGGGIGLGGGCGSGGGSGGAGGGQSAGSS
jgi:hypothetical protein